VDEGDEVGAGHRADDPPDLVIARSVQLRSTIRRITRSAIGSSGESFRMTSPSMVSWRRAFSVFSPYTSNGSWSSSPGRSAEGEILNQKSVLCFSYGSRVSVTRPRTSHTVNPIRAMPASTRSPSRRAHTSAIFLGSP